jgi:hypothetical protein
VSKKVDAKTVRLLLKKRLLHLNTWRARNHQIWNFGFRTYYPAQD